MIEIPDRIKEFFLSDLSIKKNFKLVFYQENSEALYPYETLFPEESLYPADPGNIWLEIDNTKIVSESLTIVESLSESNDMEFGSCESNMIEITVADIIEDLTGHEFQVLLNVDNYEMSLGFYTVTSFVRQSNRRLKKITGYDRMQRFNVDVSQWYNSLTFPMSLKTLRDSLCDFVGIEQIYAALPLDTMMVQKTIDPAEISGLEVLQSICQINGAFGHIDRLGALKYIILPQTGLYPGEDLFPEESLFPSEFGSDGKPIEVITKYRQSMTYEDYLVQGITGLTIREQEGDIGASVGNSDSIYVIEGNFLVFGKDASELLKIANTILPNIYGRTYRPASLACNAMPWIEVGDALRIPTRDDIVETFVMKRTMSGCQAMKDTIESKGSQTRDEVFGLHKEIIQLEGKSAILVRTVEEVSVKVTDLKNDVEAQLKVTAEQITAEVTRAKAAEEKLGAELKVTAEQISLKVSKGEVSSQLSVESGQITIKSNRFSWEATNSSMSLDGTLNAKNGSFTGDVTANSFKTADGKIVLSGGKLTITGAEINGTANTSSIGCSVMNANHAEVGRLVVNNDSQFSGEITADDINCDYISCRTIYSSSAGESWSDKRLKKDIKSISRNRAENIIRKLRPVVFSFKKTGDPGMGFIAQEVKKIEGDFCLTGSHNGYMTVCYQNFIPIIISGLQDQQRKIEKIENIIRSRGQ